VILLVDADSLIFASCYSPKSVEGMFFDKIEDVIYKFDEVFQSIINDLTDQHNVTQVLVFNDGRANFRKLITKKYKANRINQTKPPLLQEIHKYVRDTYDSHCAVGMETDDLVAIYWNKLSEVWGRDQVMIVSIDKDYLQFPALVYRYHTKELCDLNTKDARYNFYEQMIVGDQADNVNYFFGKGKKFAEKYFKDCFTEYQYRKKLYLLFKERYKSKAKEKYSECYNLLKLRTE
jgi:5'-3' exonuclease